MTLIITAALGLGAVAAAGVYSSPLARLSTTHILAP
jgi:hypothetical protein